jgi:AraC-like DNA-binding protein
VLPPSRAIRQRLARARDAVHARYDSELTVRALAAEAGLSPYHFVRTFRVAYGLTPHDYLTRVRLDRARERLALGASVTRTCVDVGFASVGSFSSLFRRALGCSPSEYQRAVRAQVVVPADLSRVHVPHCFLAHFSAQFSRSDPAAALVGLPAHAR